MSQATTHVVTLVTLWRLQWAESVSYGRNKGYIQNVGSKPLEKQPLDTARQRWNVHEISADNANWNGQAQEQAFVLAGSNERRLLSNVG